MKEVTDPALLAELEAAAPAPAPAPQQAASPVGQPVSDPALLADLEGSLAPFDPAAYGNDFKAARAAIDKMPVNRRKQAIDQYAKHFVGLERENGGLLQSINDHVRMAARNVPIVGEFADEANALTSWMGGGDYELTHAAEQERRRQIDATERDGVNIPYAGKVDTGDVAKTAGLVGGLFAAPMAAPFKGGSVAAAGGNAMTNAAIYAGAEGAGRANDGTIADRAMAGATDAATAAPLGFAGGVAGQKIANWAGKGKPVFAKGENLDEVRQRATAGYKAADDAGVIFSENVPKRLARDVINDLTEFGYHPSLQPKVKVLLDEADRLMGGNVSLKGMDTFRKMAVNVAKSTDPSERALAGKIIEKIDDAILSPRKGDVITGNAQGASKALIQARQDWKTMRKVELLEDAVKRAEDRIASTYGGGNADNAIRQQLRRVLDNKRTSKMFSPAEREEIRAVVKGGRIGDVMRLIGKWSPTSGMNSAGYIVGGSMAGAPALMGTAAVTSLAKAIGNRMTRGNADDLISKISGGQIGTQFGRWQNMIRSAATPATKEVATKALAQAISNATGLSVTDAAAALAETLQGELN